MKYHQYRYSMERLCKVPCLILLLIHLSLLQGLSARTLVYSSLTHNVLRNPVPEYCGRSPSHNEEHNNIYGGTPRKEAHRIVGGLLSTSNEWPWLVSLQFTSKYTVGSMHNCGGTLINDQWVLSASHCFELEEAFPDAEIKYSARVGEHHLLNNEASEENIEIEKIILYPGRVHTRFDNDLSLVKLARKVNLNRYVNVICLPDAGEELADGTSVLTSGWGRVAEGGTISMVVKHLVIPVINPKLCRKIYSNVTYQEPTEEVICDDPAVDMESRETRSEENQSCRTVLYNKTVTESVDITEDMMCAGLMEGGHGNCHGDSGGPLIYYNKEIRGWILAGVVSFTNGCARPGYPAVYVKVSRFIPWIERTIAENSK